MHGAMTSAGLFDVDFDYAHMDKNLNLKDPAWTEKAEKDVSDLLPENVLIKVVK